MKIWKQKPIPLCSVSALLLCSSKQTCLNNFQLRKQIFERKFMQLWSTVELNERDIFAKKKKQEQTTKGNQNHVGRTTFFWLAKFYIFGIFATCWPWIFDIVPSPLLQYFLQVAAGTWNFLVADNAFLNSAVFFINWTEKRECKQFFHDFLQDLTYDF